jgi:hypothetical protein
MILPPLEVIDSEIGNFAPAQPTAEHQSKHRPVAAALQAAGIGSPEQGSALFRRQPVPEPHADPFGPLYTPNASRQFGTEESGVPLRN